jgi:hypothetical protein
MAFLLRPSLAGVVSQGEDAMTQTLPWKLALILLAIALVFVVLVSIATADEGTGTIVGTVTDRTTGEPLVGVTIRVSCGCAITAVSDSTGSFIIRGVPVGIKSLICERPGYFAVRENYLSIRDDHPISVALKMWPVGSGGIITGKAIDISTGEPVADAVVQVLNHGGSVTTDSGGVFVFPDIVSGVYTVSCEKNGLTVEPEYNVEVESEDTTSVVFYMLKRGLVGVVTGVVIDAVTGDSLSGARVFVEGTSRSAVSDTNGSFIIADVPRGSHMLVCEKIGYPRQRISNFYVFKERVRRLVFRLAMPGTAGRIEGVVRDKVYGETLPGANVCIDGTTMGAMSNFDGSFYIYGVPQGRYSVSIEYVGFEKQTRSVVVQAGTTVEIEFSLEVEPIIMFFPFPHDLGWAYQEYSPRRSLYRFAPSTWELKEMRLSALPVKTVDDAIETQIGFVRESGHLHFRGGRSHEVLYLLDGVPINDPLTGSGLVIR